jgi:hypothetical protein
MPISCRFVCIELDKIRIFFDTTNYENVVENARVDTQCGGGICWEGRQTFRTILRINVVRRKQALKAERSFGSQ